MYSHPSVRLLNSLHAGLGHGRDDKPPNSGFPRNPSLAPLPSLNSVSFYSVVPPTQPLTSGPPITSTYSAVSIPGPRAPAHQLDCCFACRVWEGQGRRTTSPPCITMVCIWQRNANSKCMWMAIGWCFESFTVDFLGSFQGVKTYGLGVLAIREGQVGGLLCPPGQKKG